METLKSWILILIISGFYPSYAASTKLELLFHPNDKLWDMPFYGSSNISFWSYNMAQVWKSSKTFLDFIIRDVIFCFEISLLGNFFHKYQISRIEINWLYLGCGIPSF